MRPREITQTETQEGGTALPEKLRLAKYLLRSDSDLASLVIAGDHRAFDALTVRYRDPIYALALSSLGDEEEAGDAVCDAFVSAFRDVHSAGKACTPRVWLYLHALRAVLARLSTSPGKYTIERRIRIQAMAR